MKADLLRRAARRVRMDSFNGGDEFLDAVADWLDSVAEASHGASTVGERLNALAVARAYLGEGS